MLYYILAAVAVLIAVPFILAAFKPSDFHIERSVLIAAPPSVIFPYVNDFKKAHLWNPWVKVEPTGQFTFEGAPSGVGAVSCWVGKRIGSGRQTIVESIPNKSIKVRLEFLKPMALTCAAAFDLRADGERTHVTWGFSGVNKYAWKVMGVFVNQDQMLGGQFEKGLIGLKTLAENESGGVQT
jgi:Polyketide cyclase / dehydrase and lipid transport